MGQFDLNNAGNFVAYSGSGVCPASASTGRQNYRGDSYYMIATGSSGGTFTGEFQARIPSTPVSGTAVPLVNSWVPIVGNNMTLDGVTTIVTGSGLFWIPAVNGLETRINFTAMSPSGAIVTSYVSAN